MGNLTRAPIIFFNGLDLASFLPHVSVFRRAGRFSVCTLPSAFFPNDISTYPSKFKIHFYRIFFPPFLFSPTAAKTSRFFSYYNKKKHEHQDEDNQKNYTAKRRRAKNESNL